jgi:hypothetical protein
VVQIKRRRVVRKLHYVAIEITGTRAADTTPIERERGTPTGIFERDLLLA